MDFLNKAIAQVERTVSLDDARRAITAGLLLAVVVVSVGYLFQHSSTRARRLSVWWRAAVRAASLPHRSRDCQGGPLGLSARRLSHSCAVRATGQVPCRGSRCRCAAAELQHDPGKLRSTRAARGNRREATRERLKIARQQTLSEIVRAMYWVENAIVLYDEHEIRGLRQVISNESKPPRRLA